MAVKTDDQADLAEAGRIDAKARVRGRVIVLFVEARHLYDMDHLRDAQNLTIRIDDRRGVKAVPALFKIKVWDRHYTQTLAGLLQPLDRRMTDADGIG